MGENRTANKVSSGGQHECAAEGHYSHSPRREGIASRPGVYSGEPRTVLHRSRHVEVGIARCWMVIVEQSLTWL